MTTVASSSAPDWAENSAGCWADNEFDPQRTPATEPGLPPEVVADEREFLTQLWRAVEQLPLLQRLAYLLPNTDRAAELFWLYGVASVRQIGRTLQLTPEQLQRAWVLLDWRAEQREQSQRLTTYDEQFALLWQQLPLQDLTLAALLATSAPNVSQLRQAALQRLRRSLSSQGGTRQ